MSSPKITGYPFDGRLLLPFDLLSIEDRVCGQTYRRLVDRRSFLAGLSAGEKPCAADERADIDEAQELDGIYGL